MIRDEVIIEIQNRLNVIRVVNGYDLNLSFIERNPEEDPNIEAFALSFIGDPEIKLSNIPQEVRGKVNQRANEIRKLLPGSAVFQNLGTKEHDKLIDLINLKQNIKRKIPDFLTK